MAKGNIRANSLKYTYHKECQAYHPETNMLIMRVSNNNSGNTRIAITSNNRNITNINSNINSLISTTLLVVLDINNTTLKTAMVITIITITKTSMLIICPFTRDLLLTYPLGTSQ